MCLTHPLSLDFYSRTFWKRYVLRQTGVAVLYCIGSIVRNGVLTFWRIQSTGWHGRINIRWLDDEVLTIVFCINTFPKAREGNAFFLAKIWISHQTLVADCILIHALTLSIVDSLRWGKAHLHIPISSSPATVQTPLSRSSQHCSFFSTLQQNAWALSSRIEVARQGSWHRGLESHSHLLEGATGQILPLTQATVGRRVQGGTDPHQGTAPDSWWHSVFQKNSHCCEPFWNGVTDSLFQHYNLLYTERIYSSKQWLIVTTRLCTEVLVE